MMKWPFAVPVVLSAMGLAAGALAQGGPTIRITEEPVVVQPPPFSLRGETVVVPRTRIEIDEGRGRRSVTVRDLPPVRERAEEKETDGTAAEEPAADGSGCQSRILCGDPLRRRTRKPEYRQ
jgi:hypothetical protein